jgi:antitoxin (DNA-binding transcriptional repressor) of toxin-antitoxin stability system
MRVFVEIAETTERLEDLIELAARGDDITICRDDRPIAMTSIAKDQGLPGQLLRLSSDGRKIPPESVSLNHDFLSDEYGLSK